MTCEELGKRSAPPAHTRRECKIRNGACEPKTVTRGYAKLWKLAPKWVTTEVFSNIRQWRYIGDIPTRPDQMRLTGSYVSRSANCRMMKTMIHVGLRAILGRRIASSRLCNSV
eukprot:6207321-Pleurochrysis_carterae.AAC.1